MLLALTLLVCCRSLQRRSQQPIPQDPPRSRIGNTSVTPPHGGNDHMGHSDLDSSGPRRERPVALMNIGDARGGEKQSDGTNVPSNLRGDDKLLLTEVAKARGGKLGGELDEYLCELAIDHAEWMAKHRVQTHDGDNKDQGIMPRSNAIDARYGYGKNSEIVAESWGGETPEQAAKACVKSWAGSVDAHARILFGKAKRICYSMRRGANGKYYCMGMVEKPDIYPQYRY